MQILSLFFIREYATRQAIIDECIAVQEEEERKKALEASLHAAATLLQAVWRGYLVRNQLGPYKGLKAFLRKRKRQAAAKRKKELRRKKLRAAREAKAAKKAKK